MRGAFLGGIAFVCKVASKFAVFIKNFTKSS